MILPHQLIFWIVSMHLAILVENSCDMVNSSKHGNLKIIKENPMDSRCHESIVLQKGPNERYCIAKDPDPKKTETLKSERHKTKIKVK